MRTGSSPCLLLAPVLVLVLGFGCERPATTSADPPASDADDSPRRRKMIARGKIVDRPTLGATDEDLRCEEDSACVLVDAGDCCGCTAGGVRGVVRGDRLEQALARYREHCGSTTACPSVMSSDPSCIGAVEAVCVDGRCMIEPD